MPYAAFAILLTIAVIGGWIANLIALTHMSFSHLTGELVIRVVGIFLFPVGAVYGYF